MVTLTPTHRRTTVLLVLLLLLSTALAAGSQRRAEAGAGLAISIFVEGSSTGACFGQIGGCSVSVHNGLAAGDTITVREYTDEGETDFVREVAGTSPGGFFELDGGGFVPGTGSW